MTCRRVAVSHDAARAEATSPPFVAVARMLRRFESLRKKSAPPRFKCKHTSTATYTCH